MTGNDWIIPDWPAPPRVRAVSTTRTGGQSTGPYDSFNLALHVGDDEQAVLANRAELKRQLGYPGEPAWLEQVHGNTVVDAGDCTTPVADASVATAAGQVCVVMTADCLPVLFCDRGGHGVAAAHAGWRGLAAGVLEATVESLRTRLDCPASEIMAWLGPAIGPTAFEVGDEVREAFLGPSGTAAHFSATRPGHWRMDIYALARLRLAQAGVVEVFGGGECTFTDQQRFYSYRRDRTCGRMASLAWLDESAV